MPINTIIFDMDGTLVDSASSILYGFESVVRSAGYHLAKKIDKNLIGPPLGETFQTLTGIVDQSQLEKLITDFKVYYDDSGYQKTLVYSGVDDLLRYLKKNNFRVMLATNKRITPTLKIINHLEWLTFFEAVYAIDLDADQPFLNKKSMLTKLILDQGIDTRNAVYIGDRLEDQDAAQQNNLHSITVDWGYGNYLDVSIYTKLIHRPSDLMVCLENCQ